jgi:hypothetical protein
LLDGLFEHPASCSRVTSLYGHTGFGHTLSFSLAF